MRFETSLIAGLALVLLASPVLAAERNKAATAKVVTAPAVVSNAARA